MMKMKTNINKIKRLKDKELRNKFLADQIKIGLRYQLRSLRDSQDLTQKDLADLIGTKQSVISRLEKKPERVSIPTLLDIAEALDVGVVVRFESIDTVLEWYSDPTQKKMTPRKSDEVLKELEELAKLEQKPPIQNEPSQTNGLKETVKKVRLWRKSSDSKITTPLQGTFVFLGDEEGTIIASIPVETDTSHPTEENIVSYSQDDSGLVNDKSEIGANPYELKDRQFKGIELEDISIHLLPVQDFSGYNFAS